MNNGSCMYSFYDYSVLVYANIPNYEKEPLIAVKRDNLQHVHYSSDTNSLIHMYTVCECFFETHF